MIGGAYLGKERIIVEVAAIIAVSSLVHLANLHDGSALSLSHLAFVIASFFLPIPPFLDLFW